MNTRDVTLTVFRFQWNVCNWAGILCPILDPRGWACRPVYRVKTHFTTEIYTVPMTKVTNVWKNTYMSWELYNLTNLCLLNFTRVIIHTGCIYDNSARNSVYSCEALLFSHRKCSHAIVLAEALKQDKPGFSKWQASKISWYMHFITCSPISGFFQVGLVVLSICSQLPAWLGMVINQTCGAKLLNSFHICLIHMLTSYMT